MRHPRWWTMVVLVGLAACGYRSPDNNPGDDAAPDGPPPLPDAGPCAGPSVQCFTDGDTPVLRTCEAAGAEPVTEACAWGCVDGATPHCGELRPSGGVLTSDDLKPRADDAMLTDIAIDAATSFDADTGEIAGVRAAGQGVISGIGFELRTGAGVFRFKSLAVDAVVDITGANAVVIVSLASLTVNEEIDLTRCNDPACPGGFPGGNGTTVGGGGDAGGRPGTGGNDNSSGGGGGGHGGDGGTGGAGAAVVSPLGGASSGTPEIAMLLGGGGGGGGGNTGGRGGNGGGAIQLVSNNAIAFTAAGRINAGGCGGQSGQDQRAAGGGGAGGAVLLEAPSITLAAQAIIAVNGGGGGGGDRPSEGARNGDNATFSASPALGGAPGNKGGQGGDGGASTTFAGQDGTDSMNGGGGGGAVGRIRLNTRTGTVTVDPNAIVSPVVQAGSPASFGTATVD